MRKNKQKTETIIITIISQILNIKRIFFFPKQHGLKIWAVFRAVAIRFPLKRMFIRID